MSIGSDIGQALDSQPAYIWGFGAVAVGVVGVVWYRGQQAKQKKALAAAVAAQKRQDMASYQPNSVPFNPDYGTLASQGLRGLGAMTGHGQGPMEDIGPTGYGTDEIDFAPHPYSYRQAIDMGTYATGVDLVPLAMPAVNSYLGPGSEVLN